MDTRRDIVARTFEFAVQVVRLGDRVPRGSAAGKLLFSQVVRAGTSIGANAEEAQAGESRADFVHTYGIALKEREKRTIGCDGSKPPEFSGSPMLAV